VLGIVHSVYRPIPGEIKDYIAFPKPNGYQSLHTKILTGVGGIAEIQIRTEDMHRVAQFGIASHGMYKEHAGKRTSVRDQYHSYLEWMRHMLPTITRFPPLRAHKERRAPDTRTEYRVPLWLKEIAESQDTISASDEFLENLRSDFFSHRVFVFTPRGDVIDLPVESSPVDFAYAIHSDIGDHMAGAKVNGKMVSIDTVLKNGDIVEIITKPSGHPTQKWIDLAKTALARKHIRNTIERENAKSSSKIR
jgi:GTP pyrophosphokinase